MRIHRADEAEKRFLSGLNCAQSVLSSFSEDLGLDEETAIRIAAPFGGGMGRRCQTCGAVTGGLMVLGLVHADPDPENRKTKARVLILSQDFLDSFREREGSLGCKELLGIDIGSEEGQKIAREQDLFHTLCPGFVRTSVEILEEILTGVEQVRNAK